MMIYNGTYGNEKAPKVEKSKSKSWKNKLYILIIYGGMIWISTEPRIGGIY